MATCQSWRPKRHSKHPIPQTPVDCRACWTVCTNLVPKSVKRCDDCTALLVACKNPDIRRALAQEPDALETTLLTLSEDENFSVALSADNALDARGRGKTLITNRSNREAADFQPGTHTRKPFPWANN